MSDRNDPIDLTAVDSSPEIRPVRGFRPWASVSPPRPPRRRGRPNHLPAAGDEVIELESDSDSDFEMPPPARRTTARLFRAEMANLDAALMRHNRGLQELQQQEAALIRAVQDAAPQAGPARPADPGPAAAGPARNRLGGAVFRGGDREVRFAPGQPAQHFLVDRGGQAVEESLVRPLRQPRRGVRDAVADMVPMLGGGFVFGGGPPAGFNMADLPAGVQVHLLGHLGGRGHIFGAGPANARPEDVATIVAKVTIEVVPPARADHTRTWDIDEIEAAAPIEVDDVGDIVKPKKSGKPYLACANCPEPLRISGAARDNDDRVWGLKCGHLVDERCLKLLSTPDEPESEVPSPKRRRPAPRKKPVEHTFNCPTCDREHVSHLIDGEWKQKANLGGTLLFV